MWLLIISCITFFILNSSMATTYSFYSENQCQILGDKCQQNTDCCSDLTCYSIESMFILLFFSE